MREVCQGGWGCTRVAAPPSLVPREQACAARRWAALSGQGDVTLITLGVFLGIGGRSPRVCWAKPYGWYVFTHLSLSHS